MAFCFQIGPSVLGLGWSGASCGAGAVARTRTQGRPWSRTRTGTNVSPGFRAGVRTDATPWAGAGIWARQSGMCGKIGFVDVVVSRLSVFKGVSTDPRTTHWVLFHSIYAQS